MIMPKGVTTELAMEEKLMQQLEKLEYQRTNIKTEQQLLENLKTQLEIHNKTNFDENEFKDILHYLNGGTIFEKAKKLRDHFPLKRTDGSTKYIRFINAQDWCKNEYQIANQITVKNSTTQRRFDVTILINGMPLVQIELKKRGLEIKEAFKQIQNYKTAYAIGEGLFEYIQVFIVSNSITTKYYANNNKLAPEQLFYWSDENNSVIGDLKPFTDTFLEPCHISEMICRHMILSDAKQTTFILRPYQFYAVKNILKLVEYPAKNIDSTKENTNNGYVWHATGSGKTLTSFKASQVIASMNNVDKVVFVVDRRDLDSQTMTEFEAFEKDSVSGTANTNQLIEHLKASNSKTVVTTIQKLANAVKRMTLLKSSDGIENKRFVFIFDECHRSQFGAMHKQIKTFFKNNQMVGFTGTPIFEENAQTIKINEGVQKTPTTESLFNKRLHTYTTLNAISDGNVLPFSVEYIGNTANSHGSVNRLNISGEVAASTLEEGNKLKSDERVDAVAKYIVQQHRRKTYEGKGYNGIFATASIEMLLKYYTKLKEMKERGEHNLKIATIFSYSGDNIKKEEGFDGANNTAGTVEEGNGAEVDTKHIDTEMKDKFNTILQDYNAEYKTNFSADNTSGYTGYYGDVSERVKRREIDILIVVDMFLTGFDSKYLSVIYVDKNLKYHGLVQAFSRTNRTESATKKHGNVVAFRGLKDNVDKAVELFTRGQDSIKNASMVIGTFLETLQDFNDCLQKLYKIAPTPQDVVELKTEAEKVEFVKAFRKAMRAHEVVNSFADFDMEKEEVDTTPDEFAEFKSQYIDVSDSVRKASKKVAEDAEDDVSLANIDFELEVLHNDHINVDYIMKLLDKAQTIRSESVEKAASQAEHEYDSIMKEIQRTIMMSPTLHKKKDLINLFIDDELPKLKAGDQIQDAFDKFSNEQGEAKLDEICETNELDWAKIDTIVRQYRYSKQLPRTKNIRDAIIKENVGFVEKKRITDNVMDEIIDFVAIYD